MNISIQTKHDNDEIDVDVDYNNNHQRYYYLNIVKYPMANIRRQRLGTCEEGLAIT